MDYVIQNYNGVDLQHHTVLPADGKRFVDSGSGPVDMARHYRIFDKPDENRLMITASIGDAVAIGAVRGLIKIDTNSPVAVYKEAALDWLRSRGRDCRAVESSELIRLQYEIRYACGADAVRPAAVAAAGPKRP
jgi:hypothetical protein